MHTLRDSIPNEPHSYHHVKDNMKLPKTKYEPTMLNGEPHGIPYRKTIRVLAPGTFAHPEWLPHPFPQGVDIWDIGGWDEGLYANCIIRDVPVSCLMGITYDTLPASNSISGALTFGEPRDFIVYVQAN